MDLLYNNNNNNKSIIHQTRRGNQLNDEPRTFDVMLTIIRQRRDRAESARVIEIPKIASGHDCDDDLDLMTT